MSTKKYQRPRDLRDIGQVVSLIDKMNAAREVSSCCVGVEALLETNDHIPETVDRRLDGATGNKKE